MLKIKLNRLKPQAEKIIAEEQAGFRAGRIATEQIFNLRILCEKYVQYQQDLYHVFIDFRKGRWGTTYDFATSFLHFPLFSTALCDLPNSRPVHSLMLSSHLFLCLPCLLPPFTVPCKMVLARTDERETCRSHFSFCLFMIMILSRYVLKRVGESSHPFRTPTVVRNQSPMLFFKKTALVALS